MIYVLVSTFIVVSIIIVSLLFDRQLYTRSYHKTVVFLQRLQVFKTKRQLKRPAIKLFRSYIKRLKNFLSRPNIARIPLVSVLSLLIIVTTAGLCYALITNNSLEVYHVQDTPYSTVNSQISQLLIGERLRPPPPSPEELFAELDAEIASYQASKTEEGYWPETQTNMPEDNRPLILSEPDLSELHTQDHTNGYSGDMLASHLHSGHINIKNADRNWKKMNSDFVQRLLTVYKVMSDQYGYDMVLLEGYRSPARQARLLKKGSHVTKAGSYKSYHQFGLAADSAFIRNGKIVISEKDPWAMQGYKLYGKVAKSAGLVWGGDWRMMDLGHVELRKKGVLGRPEMAEILTSQ